MRFRVIGMAALALAAVTARPSQAQVLDAGWQVFHFGVAPTVATSFTVSSTGPFRVRVVDCCVIGDRFRLHTSFPIVYDYGSAVDPLLNGVSSGCFDGDTCWADGRLAMISLTFEDPGSWDLGTWGFDIELLENASGTTNGSGFYRVESLSDPGVVPEPSTYLLMASGLVGLAGVARQRRRQ